MAQSFRASVWRWTSSCVSSRAWPQGWASGAQARVFEVDPNTVLGWLVEAADQLRAFSQCFLHDVSLRQVQLDELYAVLSAVKDGEVRKTEAIERLSRSPHWVWVVMDPESKLLLTMDVGECMLAMAQGVVHQVMQVLAPGCIPLFLTDGFKEYVTALLTHYGHQVQLPRRHASGPMPKPRWIPLPQLLYAQVVKTTRRRRLVGVKHRVACGALEAVQQVLAACGWQINPAFVERLNQDIRQRVAAVGRWVTSLCKGEASVQQQVVLFQAYHNFCLPQPAYACLRLRLSRPTAAAQPSSGGPTRWRWRPD
jgi:hypothetical protein